MTRLPSLYDRDHLSQLWQQMKTREYCQWASPYLLCLRTPLGALSLAATASLLCGLFGAPQGYVVFVAILGTIGIGCAWPWIGIRGVSCQLRFTVPRTEEGQAVDMELVINNRWPWPVWGLAVEGGCSLSEKSSDQPQIAVSCIAGWSRSHFRRPFAPTLRGRYPISKPQLVTEFPFGLWKGSRSVKVESSLLVWPARFTLPPLSPPSGIQSWVGQPGEWATGSIGHRTTVRDYQRGDSMRQVHWAKTALYDKLVSYEREGAMVSNAIVTLDTHPKLHKGSGEQSSIEWTIRIAASICEALLCQGVDLTILTHTSQFHALSRSNDLTGLLDWFALIDARNGSMPDSCLRSRSTRFTNDLTVHITTDLGDSFSGDSIVYRTDCEGPVSVNQGPMSRSWITVRSDGDVPTQIRNSWRNGPGSFCYAV
jgi:uncharacterized protein (DUF58 family)